MRKAVLAAALVLLSSGASFGFDRPAWLAPKPSHHARPAAGCSGCVDDSPLCPQLAPFVFDQSQCKMSWHAKTPSPECTGPQIFPPLPYSHRAAGYAGPGSSAFPH
jgi:hypothetical protein